MIIDIRKIAPYIVSQVHKNVPELKEYEKFNHSLLAAVYFHTAKWEYSGRKDDLNKLVENIGLNFIMSMYFDAGEFEKMRCIDFLYDEKFIKKLEKNSRKIFEALVLPDGTPYVV